MRPRFEVVPRAVAAAQGAEGFGRETSNHLSMLGTAACRCGPGRAAGPRYMCVVCAAFARIGKRIEARTPHRYTEQRSA